MTVFRPARLAAIAAIAAAALLVAGAPANAAGDVSTGQWYLDAFHLDDIHAEGLTGSGVTVAIIDSSINTAIPALQSANITVREPSFCLDGSGEFYPAVSADLTGPNTAFHGTTIAAMIVGTGAAYDGQAGIRGIAPDAKVLYYAATTDTGAGDGTIACATENGSSFGLEESVAAAMNEAMDAGADIISVSLAINGTLELSQAILRAHAEGVVVLAGVPNVQAADSGLAPGIINSVVAVQTIDASAQSPTEDIAGQPVPIQFTYTTVAGPGTGVLAQGVDGGAWEDQQLVTGTSYATPAVAGFLALVKQKYPSATGAQLIQDLIRNTGTTDHELVRDDIIGYGIASATHMLANDPAQYADENPLIRADGVPSPEEFAAGPSADPTDTPADPGQPSAGPSTVLIVILAIAGLLVVIAIVVVIILAATRRSRGGPAQR